MPKFVGAIDQGTTSTRFMLFDHEGNVVASDQKEHKQIYPQPGWVEHDPLEIWNATISVISNAIKKSGLLLEDIAALGITNQRETTIIWDRNTGKPYHNAIVWQDTRTDQICNELAREKGIDRFRSIVGLPLATYFSGPKIKWLIENDKEVKHGIHNGDALFGTIDTWLNLEFNWWSKRWNTYY